VATSVTIATALAWVAIFGSSAGLVRACFSRARGHTTTAFRAEGLAVLVTATAALGFLVFGYPRQALACAIVCASALGVAAWRPSVKQLKPVGLVLAAMSLVALLAIAA
jgi:hypothetical protein